MDHLSPQQRHANMAAIHSKDTKPELQVRRFLWRRGFRYRLNHPRLPGKPDIVLRKYRTCIFVNGCFWHGHNVMLSDNIDNQQYIENSDCCKIPHTNRDFWVRKIRRNQQRDDNVRQQLAFMGWHSITIWECQLKPKQCEQTLDMLVYTLDSLFLRDHAPKSYSSQEESTPMAAEDASDYNIF